MNLSNHRCRIPFLAWFLLAFLNSHLPQAYSREEDAEPVRILVIGGGISGLAAARHLMTTEAFSGKISVDLLEAKSDRLGGRLWTVQTNQGNNMDLGGMFWHGIEAPVFATLQSELNLTTMPTQGTSQNPGKGGAKWMLMHSNATVRELDDAAIDRLPELVGLWNNTMQKLVREHLLTSQNETSVTRPKDQDPTLLSQWSQEFIATLPEDDQRLLHFQLNMIFNLDLGLPMEELALEGLMNGWDWNAGMGDDHVLLNGMSSLVEALAHDISNHRPGKITRIHKGQRVTKITYSKTSHKSSCKVQTEDGQAWEADVCIVTLPIGVLKQHHETLFDPPLDDSKKEALQRAGVGSLNSLVVQWNRPICDEDTSAYYFLPVQHEDAFVSSTLKPMSNNPLSHGFICTGLFRTGDPTITQFHFSGSPTSSIDNANTTSVPEQKENLRQYWERQAVEVVRHVLEMRPKNETTCVENGSCLTSRSVVSESDIVDLLWSDWVQDPDILGSYSSAATETNGNADRQILARSLGSSLYFAGEHTNTNGRYQSIDGAYETGVRAAREVLGSMAARELLGSIAYV